MTTSPRKILAIISYPFLPATTGGEISTLNILKYLSHQHDVTVYTVEPYSQNYDLGTSKFELIFGMPFKLSRYWNLATVFKLRRIIKTQNIDWLFFDQPWFGWILWLLKLICPAKIFIRSNNIEYLRFKSMGKWYWQMMYIYEKWTYRAADLVIFVSETDRQKAIYEFDLKAVNTLLTPYGVENDQLPDKADANKLQQLRKSLGVKDAEYMLLFFSTLSYYPNYEAAGFIADKIYPILKDNKSFEFKIIICGKGLPDTIKNKFDGKSEIMYVGFVDDINSYIDAADMMLNPLLSGGGVKTKAIDTLARGQRIISTVNGAEGIDVGVCGNCLVVINDHDWDAFAEAIVENIGAPKNMPNEFYTTYGWPGIIKRLSNQL